MDGMDVLWLYYNELDSNWIEFDCIFEVPWDKICCNLALYRSNWIELNVIRMWLFPMEIHWLAEKCMWNSAPQFSSSHKPAVLLHSPCIAKSIVWYHWETYIPPETCNYTVPKTELMVELLKCANISESSLNNNAIAFTWHKSIGPVQDTKWLLSTQSKI